MLERYEIENVEQLRAVADMLRLRIIDTLSKQPMTVTQLGEALGEAPAKMHYHVRELEKVGVLRLVETREKGGILEKYFQPIAREFSVEKTLLSAPSDESLAMMSAWLGQITGGFLREFHRVLDQKIENPALEMGFTRLYMTTEELKRLSKQIIELSSPYEKPRNIEGEQELFASLLIYPESAPATDTKGGGSPLSSLTTSKTRVIGTLGYDRAELEQVLAEGKRLDIEVVGTCSFADDVSADLADRAVSHLRVVGKLMASPAVREVLMKKRETHRSTDHT